MQPDNPIVGGTVLRRPAIQSPNFVSGVSGWTINADGSAEFTNLKIDGGSNVEITITFSDGSQIHIYAGDYVENGGGTIPGAWSTYLPKPQTGATWAPGAIGAQSSASGPSANLEIFSPYDSAHADLQSSIILSNGSGVGQSSVGIDATLMEVDADLRVLSSHSLTCDLNTATQIAIALIAQLDAHNRLTIAVNGTMVWGNGTATGDTTLYRSAAAQLAADTILANVSGSAETWHTMAGSYTAPWADFGNPQAAGRYRLMPDGTVALNGTLKTTANVTTGAAIFTLPAAYRPAANNDQSFPVVFTTSGGAVATGTINVTSAGVISLSNSSVTATLSLFPLSHVRFSLI
jgi:hypothetical protein